MKKRGAAVVCMEADGCMCRRCDGTIQEADLAEDLMVDGEMYGCVKSFCYLGDMKDRRTNEQLRRLVGVEPITTVIRSGRLR